MQDQFICHNPKGRMPSVIHYTWENALEEASRIAKKEGAEVHIYALIAKAEPEWAPVKITIMDGCYPKSHSTTSRRPSTIEEV